jgi:uncharacterized protein
MFLNFFYELKKSGIPVSVMEYLSFLKAVDSGVAANRIDDFYYLSRASLVKDERHLDRFDRVFGRVFKGLESLSEGLSADIPEEWLRALAERLFTEEEKAKIRALGGWDKLMEELKRRLAEQKERHEGGSKWIGTRGTSPYGAHGYNPEGVRIGQDKNHNNSAVKVWDKRDYKDLDGEIELGVRNIKLALRRLRKFAREGAAEELDLDNTIRGTAHKGYLDIAFRPERRNTVKVLAFFDIGGSMDYHIRECEELFSAARSEFKHLDYYYFHNCLYESVWKKNQRRSNERIPTYEVMNTYAADYKVIFVGDASMSPYEILVPGGSVEHWNEEPGQVWLQRVLGAYKHAVWLNPLAERYWEHTQSVRVIQNLMGQRMFPLTLNGIDAAIGELLR